MKILIPVPYLSVWGKDENPYVSSLAEGLAKCGHHVVCSMDDFWQDCSGYDIIYFQWPDLFFPYVLQFGIDRLRGRIKELKESGMKLVITCHNFHPHDNDGVKTQVYNLLYSEVDAVHHMGEYSYKYMLHTFPEKHHFIVPHHIADRLFLQTFSKERMRQLLDVPAHHVVIASFGAFRNDEEEQLLLHMAQDVKQKDITILAPRMNVCPLYNGRRIHKTIKCLYRRFQLKWLNVIYKGTILSEEELSQWLAASDIIFIQRTEILNSGNLPLAFSQGKIVVGPNIGNVGCILKETHNYMFDPTDRRSVKEAMTNAIEAHQHSDLGMQNLEFAKANWTTEKVCREIGRQLEYLI